MLLMRKETEEVMKSLKRLLYILLMKKMELPRECLLKSGKELNLLIT